MALVTAPNPLLLLQTLNAWFCGTMIGIVMTWFSEVAPRPGLARGLCANTGRIGSVLAGLVVGAAVHAWGCAGTFAVSAVVVGISALLIPVSEGSHAGWRPAGATDPHRSGSIVSGPRAMRM